METYYCEQCDQEKKLNKGDWSISNSIAYCYCNPDIPHLLRPGTRKDFIKFERKYNHVFKK